MSGKLTETLNAWDVKYRQGIYVRIEELQWTWLRRQVSRLEDRLRDLGYQPEERDRHGEAAEQQAGIRSMGDGDWDAGRTPQRKRAQRVEELRETQEAQALTGAESEGPSEAEDASASVGYNMPEPDGQG